MSWLPNRGTMAHDHKTWAVVAGMHGPEREVDWRRLDDGTTAGYAKLERIGERHMSAGDVTCCLPCDIHSVWNVGQDISMSLHTYGRHVNFTGRSQFDPAKDQELPYVVAVE